MFLAVDAVMIQEHGQRVGLGVGLQWTGGRPGADLKHELLEHSTINRAKAAMFCKVSPNYY